MSDYFPSEQELKDYAVEVPRKAKRMLEKPSLVGKPITDPQRQKELYIKYHREIEEPERRGMVTTAHRAKMAAGGIVDRGKQNEYFKKFGFDIPENPEDEDFEEE